MTDTYEALRPVMVRYGASCGAREFYWAVNHAYHTIEARQYDDLHETMFVGLHPIWQSLFTHAASLPEKLRILDIGAGTGLVGGFAQKYLPGRVASMTMLDPCEAMLEQCRAKAGKLSFPCEFRQGDLSAVRNTERFDVITVNSVLHHIVELPSFFSRVQTLLTPQGWLLTAQDPRAEASSDSHFLTRKKQRRGVPRNVCRGLLTRLVRLVLQAGGRPALSPLARETSNQLLAQKIIRRPMTMAAIYAVTDFHVPGQPDGIGKGLSLAQMKDWLSGLKLIDDFTYQYHGVPWTDLTAAEQEQEHRWWVARDKHGQLLASAWRRNLQP